jgi:hypothetical protein
MGVERQQPFVQQASAWLTCSCAAEAGMASAMPIKAIRAGFMRGFSTGSARIVPQPQRRSKPSRLASAAAAPQSTAMRRKARQATKAENRPRFWGRHAVTAALANPGAAHCPHLCEPRYRAGI